MRKAKKKKGINPVVAVLFLGMSAAVAARQLWGGGEIAILGPSQGEEAMPSEGTAAQVDDSVQCGDLLLAHGSFDHSKPVRVAFSTLVQVTQVAAAPGVETRPVDFGAWSGDDPPTLQLGVVMVSEASRRAVLGGTVVGIGDKVGDGEVMAIERGSVMLRWKGRVLTYDLEEQYPREFRSEMVRRRAKSESAPDLEQHGNQEEVK